MVCLTTHSRRWSICFAVLVFAASGAVSSAEQTIARVAASDDFLLQLASDPQISPDGKEIVYVRQFADIMSDHRYSNLWIVAADGRQHPRGPLMAGRSGRIGRVHSGPDCEAHVPRRARKRSASSSAAHAIHSSGRCA